jgi:Recombination endonuclease VII
MESKYCRDCEQERPLTDFTKNRNSRDGYAFYCRPCAKAAPDREGPSYWRTGEASPPRHRRAGGRDTSQGGLCAICRMAPAKHVDHDHATGAVRALLCFNCNGGLGQFRGDPGLLHLAAFYVEHHAQRQALEGLVESPGGEPDGSSRPGEPPVGSQRRPGARSTNTRSTGRNSGSRRRTQAGEADG